MPFAETQVMDQRQRFVHDVHARLLSFSELCRRYGISRKTGYKWLEALMERFGTSRSGALLRALEYSNEKGRRQVSRL